MLNAEDSIIKMMLREKNNRWEEKICLISGCQPRTFMLRFKSNKGIVKILKKKKLTDHPLTKLH